MPRTPAPDFPEEPPLPEALTEDASTTEAGRLAFLDFLRGLAATAVVLQHTSESWWTAYQRWSYEYFNFGRFGVTVFFLVSGFIIPVSLERSRSARRFWVGRFFRLYPLYWLSLGIAVWLSTLGVAHAVSAGFGAERATNTLANVTMLQELVGYPHAMGLYYTLTLEMVFYISCTIIFLIGWLERSRMLAWLAVGGVVALGIVAPLVLERRVPMAALFYLMTMFFGTVVYRYDAGKATRRAMTWLLVAVGTVGLAGVYVNYVRYSKAEGLHPFSFWGAAMPWLLAYAVFFTAFGLRAREFPALGLWLGRISYSLYLMHPPLVAITREWDSPLLGFATVVAGSLVLATLTYRFVERPALAFGRRVRSRLKSPAPPTAATPFWRAVLARV